MRRSFFNFCGSFLCNCEKRKENGEMYGSKLISVFVVFRLDIIVETFLQNVNINTKNHFGNFYDIYRYFSIFLIFISYYVNIWQSQNAWKLHTTSAVVCCTSNGEKKKKNLNVCNRFFSYNRFKGKLTKIVKIEKYWPNFVRNVDSVGCCIQISN